MRRTRRLLISLVSISFAVAVGLGPPASAQDGCTLLTVEEVTTAFGLDGVTSEASGTFCSFSSDATSVFIILQPGADLAAQREQYADATDSTVAGLPALVTEEGRSVVVGLPGQVLGLTYYGDTAWTEALPILTDLLELAVPRAPAGPSAEDMARLTALLPETIGGLPTTLRSFGGDLLLGFMDQTAAPVITLNEALAAQGLTAADILLVGRETTDEDNGDSVVAILIKGADAAQLVEPLFAAFDSGDEPRVVTPIEVGGRAALRIEGGSQGPVVAAASGDVILAATVPEAELESVLSRLP